MTSDNWLQIYLEESVRKNLCSQIYCTTCGALEFRRGVFAAFTKANDQRQIEKLDREAALEITKALAGVQPIQSDARKFEAAARCLLFDLWSGMPFLDRAVEEILSGSWAGDILRRMQEHDRATHAERRAREEFELPASVQKRREEKKRIRQEQHRQRLELKKERDRLWHKKHGEQT